LVYVSASGSIFALLSPNACVRFDTGDGEIAFLEKDLSVDCDSPRHARFVGYAWILLIIYPLGTPLLYMWLYWINRRKMRPLIDSEAQISAASVLLKVSKGRNFNTQLFASSRTPDFQQVPHSPPPSPPSTNKEHSDSRSTRFTFFGRQTSFEESMGRPRVSKLQDVLKDIAKTSSEVTGATVELPKYMLTLVGPYDYKCYWYETVECVRKVLLTGIVVFFPRGSIGQLLVGLMLSIVLSWFVHHIKPYRSAFDDILAQVAQGVVIFTIISKIMLQDMARHGTSSTWLPLVEAMLISFQLLPFMLAVCLAVLESSTGKKGSTLFEARFVRGRAHLRRRQMDEANSVMRRQKDKTHRANRAAREAKVMAASSPEESTTTELESAMHDKDAVLLSAKGEITPAPGNASVLLAQEAAPTSLPGAPADAWGQLSHRIFRGIMRPFDSTIDQNAVPPDDPSMQEKSMGVKHHWDAESCNTVLAATMMEQEQDASSTHVRFTEVSMEPSYYAPLVRTNHCEERGPASPSSIEVQVLMEPSSSTPLTAKMSPKKGVDCDEEPAHVNERSSLNA